VTTSSCGGKNDDNLQRACHFGNATHGLYSHAVMGLTSGTKLGPYEIQLSLGAGGMGEVYQAIDTRLGRTVAIKILPESFAKDADRLQRFEHEARLLSALNHPNLLTIFDVGSQDGTEYLVSEFLEGQTLRECLSHGALQPRRTIDYAMQIASGLSAAHHKTIVHRDLKPENVFVTGDERVKILDFGLAKQTHVIEATAEGVTLTGPMPTASGVILGTVGYMSPEQVRGQPTDHRSDIFSFGAILYEMLSGKRAFRDGSSIETMNAILKAEPPELSESGLQINPGLERIVRRCLEKTPDRRFQSASDLAFAIEALSGTYSCITPQGRTKESSGRHKWLPLLVLAPVLLVSAGAGFLLSGLRQAKRSRLGDVLFQQLNFQPEVVFNARYAPDGETVLYSAARDGNIPELFIHRPDYPAPQPMDLHDVRLLSVSARGEVAVLTDAVYLAQRQFRGTLSAVALGGGAPRQILQDVREADWSPDGTKLAVIREMDGKDRLEFPIGKVLYTASGYLSDLRFSPRGDRIAFFDHPTKYDDRGSIDVVDLEGHIRVLSDGYQAEEGLAWSPTGETIFFSGQLGNGFNLIVYELTLSGQRRTVLAAPDDLWVLDVSKSGKLLVSRGEYQERLMALAPSSGAEQDLSWLDNSNNAVLSADGRTLLFSDGSAVAGLNYALCLRKTGGTPVVRLGDGNAQGLSPDGKWALSIVPTSPMRLTLYPTGAGEPKSLENGGIQAYDSATFFPDGKRILACGNESGQAVRCYVQELAGGTPRAVTPPGTSHGMISPDGKTILARSASGGFLTYSTGGGEPGFLSATTQEDEVVHWSSDGQSVLIYRTGEVPARIERLNLSTGKRVPVVQLSPPSRAGVINVRYVTFSQDERSYAYTFDRVLCRLSSVSGFK
jgi:serine/threonine protein kinase/Tol biopolymer transport system component